MATGKDFFSDNAAPAHPLVMAALAKANEGTASPYGDDPWTAELKERMCELFGRRVWTFPLLTGTAANAIALATLTPPYGAVFCHENAHIHVDECGASEMMSGGAKLVPVPGEAGRISLTALERVAARMPRGVMHHNQPAALSLTQGTEYGTVYHPSQIAALSAFAHALGLKVHMDGARFANAVVGLSASPAALSVEAGIDVLCFGATKNGALAAEAMIFFDEALAERAIYFQKRAGQAASKMRFVSAQLLAMLDNELWLENARIANQMAWRLAEGAAALGHALRYPVEINEVFLSLPRSAAEGLRMEGFQFQTSGPEPASGAGLYRFVASFATEPADIDRLLRALKAVPPTAARG
jgi:threonine aldolase